jgi:F-type H+-transporting ATPase subunit b
MTELLHEPEFWVAVALLMFFGLLVYFGVPKAALGAIDARGKAIQAELDEAKRIREEAQALLDSLKQKRAEAEVQAQEMLAAAEAEARRYEAEAKAKLEESLTRRQALAERKIAQAEAQASAEVKAAAAEMAAEAAESLLRKRLKGKRSDPLVDRGVEQLADRLR